MERHQPKRARRSHADTEAGTEVANGEVALAEPGVREGEDSVELGSNSAHSVPEQDEGAEASAPLPVEERAEAADILTPPKAPRALKPQQSHPEAPQKKVMMRLAGGGSEEGGEEAVSETRVVSDADFAVSQGTISPKAQCILASQPSDGETPRKKAPKLAAKDECLRQEPEAVDQSISAGATKRSLGAEHTQLAFNLEATQRSSTAGPFNDRPSCRGGEVQQGQGHDFQAELQ